MQLSANLLVAADKDQGKIHTKYQNEEKDVITVTCGIVVGTRQTFLSVLGTVDLL